MRRRNLSGVGGTWGSASTGVDPREPRLARCSFSRSCKREEEGFTIEVALVSGVPVMVSGSIIPGLLLSVTYPTFETTQASRVSLVSPMSLSSTTDRWLMSYLQSVNHVTSNRVKNSGDHAYLKSGGVEYSWRSVP